MSKANKIDMIKIMLAAQKKSYQAAFENAVRTGTALVFSRKGKIIEYKPPYKYVLVPIAPKRKKTAKSKNKK